MLLDARSSTTLITGTLMKSVASSKLKKSLGGASILKHSNNNALRIHHF